MNWIDIACIVFVCVTANHLGLIEAIEGVLGVEIPIVGCVKCLTFWVVLGYGACVGNAGHFGTVLAISLLASTIARWLELLEGYIDTLYLKLYEKIYPDAADNAPAADATGGDTDGAVS